MITDRENTFFENLLPTTGTQGDVIQIFNRQRHRFLDVYVQVASALNNLTDLTFSVVSSAAADLSSPTTVATSGTVVLATLNAAGGYRWVAPLGSINPAHNYIGITVARTGTAPAAGAITAGIVETASIDTASRPTAFTGLT